MFPKNARDAQNLPPMLEYLQYGFFQRALVAVVLLSISAGIIGTYIISRRLVAICGGITHACFGGLGLGYFLGVSPILMAGVFALGSSAGVEWASSRFRLREDSAIAVIWALGMALGVLFVFLTPGYVPELNAFLFGNILTVGKADILAFGIFTAATVAFYLWQSRTIVAVAFDRDFAAVAGLPVRMINYTMTVLVAICIVLTIRITGIMMLMSVLSLPMITAEVFCHRFRILAVASGALSLLSCVGGLLLSTIIDVPCSVLIVLLMVGMFAGARLAAFLRKF